MFEIFLDIGLVSHTVRGISGGQSEGMIPLLWSELHAYSQINWGLVGWEAKALREMSREYIIGINLGENPLAMPPWEDAPNIMVRTKRASK